MRWVLALLAFSGPALAGVSQATLVSPHSVVWMDFAASGAMGMTEAFVVSRSPRADFSYFPDFNDTSALFFVGDAASTSCGVNTGLEYQPAHGAADGIDELSIPRTMTETTSTVEHSTIETNPRTDPEDISLESASIGHRDHFTTSPDPKLCAKRLRLTPSQPFKRGGVWHATPTTLVNGFETVFAFQVSEHSRRCTYVRDRTFYTNLYRSCVVHGGDGFAFVVQLDPNMTTTLGAGGSAMGYGGIRNALVVEFDTWYNPEEGDTFGDHVAVQASLRYTDPITGSRETDGVGAGEMHRLAVPRPHPLGDGQHHVVKIVYHTSIQYDLLDYFSAAPALLPFLKDAGENRRVGTLVVYVDNLTVPLLALPLNIAEVIDMPQTQAFMGFVSSTGRAFERHDILWWYGCEEAGCPGRALAGVDPNSIFDYHMRSNV